MRRLLPLLLCLLAIPIAPPVADGSAPIARTLTAYPPTGRPFKDGTLWTAADWHRRGNPRVVAAAASDLAAGRVRLHDRVCVTFPGGSRITYTVRDRCPDPAEVRARGGVGGCSAGHVDLYVKDAARARDFGRQPGIVTRGACR